MGSGIRAVVVDVGGVLERVDDASWPQLLIDRWERRAGRPAGTILAALAEHAPDDTIATGRLTEPQMRSLYADTLGLDQAQTDELMTEMWAAYCGELDTAMRDFVASLRPAYQTAILSNSADGARREEQRRYDFESLVDVIVYSHEVGLAKPDPAIYELTERRLGVPPHEIVFIDDVEPNIEAAQQRGWYAVHHTHTGDTIKQVSTLLAADAKV
jgi:putative hydrolase of the HAD superfamily